MNGWVKLFADGTREIGNDIDVKNKKASWRGGRLNNMSGAYVEHNGFCMGILVPGEFWQSEDYEVDFFESVPRLITRRIQKKIRLGDRFYITNNIGQFFLVPEYHLPACHSEIELQINDNDIGKWITLEMNIPTMKMQYTIEETKI